MNEQCKDVRTDKQFAGSNLDKADALCLLSVFDRTEANRGWSKHNDQTSWVIDKQRLGGVMRSTDDTQERAALGRLQENWMDVGRVFGHRTVTDGYSYLGKSMVARTHNLPVFMIDRSQLEKLQR